MILAVLLCWETGPSSNAIEPENKDGVSFIISLRTQRYSSASATVDTRIDDFSPDIWAGYEGDPHKPLRSF